ncbi:MAG: SAM hydrolase/SAM-dependent halogenase family protein [Solirubrobacteraceae bacterium]
MAAPATRPVITFLSDYGIADDFVGVCHGVIATICPDARVIDLTHGIGRHDVRSGALILRESLNYMPVGVHLAVVDPDVGAQRRAVALKLADGRTLVGPDNGLLSPAAELGGGIVEAVDIARSPFRLEPVSATFHGRDIFAPVAAHLAGGRALAEAGDPLDPAELVVLELAAPRRENGAIVAHVRYVDRFGNLQLDAGHDDLAGSGLKLGRLATIQPVAAAMHAVTYARTFADVEPGEPLLYEDAARHLSVAVNHGDAAQWLAVGVDDELRIRPV